MTLYFVSASYSPNVFMLNFLTSFSWDLGLVSDKKDRILYSQIRSA